MITSTRLSNSKNIWQAGLLAHVTMNKRIRLVIVKKCIQIEQMNNASYENGQFFNFVWYSWLILMIKVALCSNPCLSSLNIRVCVVAEKAMLSMRWHDLNWHETAFDITHFSQFPTNAVVVTAAVTKAKRVLMETNESNIPQTKFNVWLFSKLLLIDVYIRKLHYWKTIWLLPQ